jgi:hypothetical protein
MDLLTVHRIQFLYLERVQRYRGCAGVDWIHTRDGSERKANMGILGAEQVGLEFLKRRLASAIARHDDETATRLTAQVDRAINGPLARRCAHDQRLRMTEHRPGQ